MKKRIRFCVLYVLFLAVAFLGTNLVLKACEPDYKKIEYSVEKGDTYDILAEKFKIKEDRRTWRERVKELNERCDSCLYTGETIYVLVERE